MNVFTGNLRSSYTITHGAILATFASDLQLFIKYKWTVRILTYGEKGKSIILGL